MNKLVFRKNPVYLASMLFLLHIFLLIAFQNNERVLGVGSDLFQTIAALLSAFWLYQKYSEEQGKGRKFWQLLSLTILCYGAGMFFLDVDEILLKIKAPFPSVADIFFMGMYVFILIDFCYLLFVNRHVIRLGQMLYDTLIVIAVAAPASWEFVFKPIFHRVEDCGIWQTLLCVAYPMGNLLILLVLLCVFRSTTMRFPSIVFTLLFAGASCFLIADTIFLYLLSKGQYASGNPVDLMWTLGNLLIGISSVFSEGVILLTKEKTSADKRHPIINPKYFLSIRLWLPYLGAFALFLLLVVPKHQVNSLVIGSMASLFLIIIRQFSTLAENEKLLEKTTNLNKELEYKVQQRTKQLGLKNQQLLETIDKVKFTALHDPLTALPNRRYFEKELKRQLDLAKERKEQIAVLFLDLDRYKLVNDTLGHSIGDLLLQQAAQRFQECIGDAGMISRHGGDEFLVMLPNADRNKAAGVAQKILESSQAVFNVNGYELFLTSSIGISMHPEHGADSKTLISRADAALYAVKKTYRNQFMFFDAAMNFESQGNLALEKDLRFALERGELFLVYQPLVKIQSGELKGVEALIRWNHPLKGIISPLMFIPAAEETGIIIPLGEWVLKTACRQWKTWVDKGLPRMTMAVNISTQQFLHPDFSRQVHRILRETGMDPNYLEMEITENIPFVSAGASALLKELRNIGIKISIDDFGTGYSSLQYLKRLPISQLKIDQSFIRELPHDVNDAAIVETILTMAHHLNLEVVAEGVETDQQLQFLQRHSCQAVQGYLFSKPLMANEFETQFSMIGKWN